MESETKRNGRSEDVTNANSMLNTKLKVAENKVNQLMIDLANAKLAEVVTKRSFNLEIQKLLEKSIDRAQKNTDNGTRAQLIKSESSLKWEQLAHKEDVEKLEVENGKLLQEIQHWREKVQALMQESDVAKSEITKLKSVIEVTKIDSMNAHNVLQEKYKNKLHTARRSVYSTEMLLEERSSELDAARAELKKAMSKVKKWEHFQTTFEQMISCMNDVPLEDHISKARKRVFDNNNNNDAGAAKRQRAASSMESST